MPKNGCPTSRDAPTGQTLFNFISESLQSRRWAHIKRSLEYEACHPVNPSARNLHAVWSLLPRVLRVTTIHES
jgi:hypothetical protein